MPLSLSIYIYTHAVSQDPDGIDAIDKMTHVLELGSSLIESSIKIDALGLALVPSELSKAQLDLVQNEGKFFLTVCSAWDTMLNTEADVSKRQRQADFEAFKVVVDESCPYSFPNSLMQIMQKWSEGANVDAVLP